MNGNRYSFTSFKQAIKYILENCFFKVGSEIFWQVTGIPMGSDHAPFILCHSIFIKLRILMDS